MDFVLIGLRVIPSGAFVFTSQFIFGNGLVELSDFCGLQIGNKDVVHGVTNQRFLAWAFSDMGDTEVRHFLESIWGKWQVGIVCNVPGGTFFDGFTDGYPATDEPGAAFFGINTTYREEEAVG